MGLLSAALLCRIRLWLLSWDQHGIVLRRMGRLGLWRLGLGLGPELVRRLAVRQRRLLQPVWFPQWVLRGRVWQRQRPVAARREPPFGSVVPEQPTGLAVWGRVDGLAERDDQIGQLEFHPLGRHVRL